MPEFRKAGRTFCKVDTEKGQFLRIVNGYAGSTVTLLINKDTVNEIMVDYLPCTEEEFNIAKSEAMTRLSLERI